MFQLFFGTHPRIFLTKNISEKKKKEFKIRNLLVLESPTQNLALIKSIGKKEIDFSITIMERATF